MKTLDHKLIIYDSNCRVCTSLKTFVLKYTSIPESKIKALKDLDQELGGKVNLEKFKNGMALIDDSGGDTIYGAEGVAHIFSSQYRLANILLSFNPLFFLFSFLYKITAYNRYIIATPKSQFQCDCFPDKVTKYRVAYISLTNISAAVLTMLFGVSLRNFFTGISALEAAIQMVLMAGTGWVVQIMLAKVFMKEKSLDYMGHLGSIMVVGLLILVPWMLFYFITGIKLLVLPILSVIVSSAYMLYMHINRVKHLDISQWWTLSWFLLLQFTAFLWVYYFHFNQ